MASLFSADEDDVLDAVAQEVDESTPAAPVEVSPRSNPDFLGHEDVEKALLNGAVLCQRGYYLADEGQ